MASASVEFPPSAVKYDEEVDVDTDEDEMDFDEDEEDSDREPEEPVHRFGNRFLDACQNGDYYVVKDCVEKGVNPNYVRGNGLYHALMRGHYHVVKYLLDHGAKLKPESLGHACVGGNLELVELLLSRGARIDAIVGDGKTYESTDYALSCSVGNNQLHVTNYLLKKGAEIGQGTLHNVGAALSQDCRLHIGKCMLDVLKSKDIPCQKLIDKALLHACRYGQLKSVEYLLSVGADVNTKFVVPCPGEEHLNGLTPIALASKFKYGPCPKELIVKLLIDHGAKPEELDPENATSEMREFQRRD